MNKKKTLFVVIAIVALVAAMAGGYFIRMLLDGGEKNPDYSITKIESGDSDEEKSVDASLQYAGYVTLINTEKRITLNFTNPTKSKKSMSLDIVANINGEDVKLASTDKIRPGYKIDSVKYTLDRKIPEGDYKGKFVVHFYNEQDNEEIVNSEIAIKVYVR